jgi:tRNA (cytidine/uridine-2'-O-)-methyltransferase
MNKPKNQATQLYTRAADQNTPDTFFQNPPSLTWHPDGYVTTDNPEHLRLFHPEVVLYNPQIPQNTGSIARLCAGFCTSLHLIEPMPFAITDKHVKRAGLDYWDHIPVTLYKSWEEFITYKNKRRFVFIETGGSAPLWGFAFKPGDLLVFGAETFGIPEPVINSHLDLYTGVKLTIPMFERGVRSINLANTVSLVLYSAIAQLHSNR